MYKKNLSQIFNRDFTTAYLEKKQGKFMMSDKRPNNRGRLIGRVVRYDDKLRRAIIKLTEDIAIGDTIDFWVKVGGRVNTNISNIFVKNKEVTEATSGYGRFLYLYQVEFTHTIEYLKYLTRN